MKPAILSGLAAGLLLLAPGLTPSGASKTSQAQTSLPGTRQVAPTSETVSCIEKSFHPLQVTVQLVDDLRTSEWMQAQVTIESRVDLANVEVQLQPLAQVDLQGSRKAGMADVISGTPSSYRFTLKVPNTREPQQVLVLVRGLANGLPLERGTVLHMLPQGQHSPGTVSAVPSVNGPVVEYSGAARRGQ